MAKAGVAVKKSSSVRNDAGVSHSSACAAYPVIIRVVGAGTTTRIGS